MKKSKLKNYNPIICTPYAVWSIIFIIVPLLMVAYYAFTDKSGAFTFSNILELPRYAKTFGISLLYSVEATIVCLLIAYPLAYFMSNMKAGAKRMLSMLIMVPMWMNFLIRTYSWITILAKTGIINTLLSYIGIGPLRLINTPGAIILGMVYNFLPYMILPIYTAMLKLDHSLLEAADDLGASPLMRLRKVILPLSMPGVISGITMVFVPCVSTFYISQKLGGGKTMLIGDVIEMQFQSSYNYNLGASISLVLMILILISLAVMNHFADKDNEDAGGLIV
ncbi:MAG: ABC transporter permease [Acutalibacteraceae bacterium]|nr:ABC transporter permease [Acutalibacteraceae bacterium]